MANNKGSHPAVRTEYFRATFEDKVLEAISLCGKVWRDLRDGIPAHIAIIARIDSLTESACRYTHTWGRESLGVKDEFVSMAAVSLENFSSLFRSQLRQSNIYQAPELQEMTQFCIHLGRRAELLRCW